MPTGYTLLNTSLTAAEAVKTEDKRGKMSKVWIRLDGYLTISDAFR